MFVGTCAVATEAMKKLARPVSCKRCADFCMDSLARILVEGVQCQRSNTFLGTIQHLLFSYFEVQSHDSLQEVLELLKLIERATEVKILKSVDVKFKIKDVILDPEEEPTIPEKRKKFKDGVLKIFSRTVRLEEVRSILL